MSLFLTTKDCSNLYSLLLLQAIRFLRMSKSIESQIVRLEEHHTNLQAVLNQIEMAETNAQVGIKNIV